VRGLLLPILLLAVLLFPGPAGAERAWVEQQLAPYPVRDCTFEVPRRFTGHHDQGNRPEYGHQVFDSVRFNVGIYWWAWPEANGDVGPKHVEAVLDALERDGVHRFERGAARWAKVGDSKAAVLPIKREGEDTSGQFTLFARPADGRLIGWWMLPNDVVGEPGVSPSQVDDLMKHAASRFRCKDR
jgi:hypothetical protein